MIKLDSKVELEVHHVRMLDEATELGNKIKALTVFIDNSPKFDRLPVSDQRKMREQLHHMQEYFKTLMLRVALI